MGLSISAAVAILFIATVIVFGTMISAIDHAQESLMDAQRRSSARAANMDNTQIAVTSVDRGNGTVSLVNEGTAALKLSGVEVLLNGTLSKGNVTSMTIKGQAETNLWLPDDILVIQFDRDLEMTKIKVAVGNGASAYA